MPDRASLRLTRSLSRVLSGVFFREVRVEGEGNVPPEGPLIYAVNHPNSLVDPLLIHGALPRSPRFLAKHTLWDIAAVRPFLKLAGSIPVYRTQDKGARTAQNLEAFDACYEALADGAVIGIFPEGVSHAGTSLMPVKTGIVRIVLGAERRHGPLGIRIVPVGLTFDARHLFRSRVLVTVGEPIGPVGDVPDDKGELRRLRNALTGRVEEALRGVTLNYGSRKEARLLERAGDLYAKDPSNLPTRPGLSELFEVRKRFAGAYEVMRERFPDRVGALARSVDAYDRMLRLTGFADEQIVSSYPGGHVIGYVARTIVRLLLYLPLGLLGAALNYVPYRVTALIARPHEKELQAPATYKILGGFFAYPAFWALEAACVGALTGWRPGVAFFLLSPLPAYAAMRFKEDIEDFVSESFNFLRLRTHRRTWADLRRRRDAVTEEIGDLARLYLESAGEEGASQEG